MITKIVSFCFDLHLFNITNKKHIKFTENLDADARTDQQS
jgi:hypothetical protein